MIPAPRNRHIQHERMSTVMTKFEGRASLAAAGRCLTIWLSMIFCNLSSQYFSPIFARKAVAAAPEFDRQRSKASITERSVDYRINSGSPKQASITERSGARYQELRSEASITNQLRAAPVGSSAGNWCPSSAGILTMRIWLC